MCNQHTWQATTETAPSYLSAEKSRKNTIFAQLINENGAYIIT